MALCSSLLETYQHRGHSWNYGQDYCIKESFASYLQGQFAPTTETTSQETVTMLILSTNQIIRHSILDAYFDFF